MKKWLMEGHSTGLCLSMVAHVCALFRGAVLLEEVETQTDAISTTADLSTQTMPTPSINAIMQIAIAMTNASMQTTTNTNTSPRQRLATLETVTDDNKPLPLARKCHKLTKQPY